MNHYEQILTGGAGYLCHEIRYKNRPLIVDTRLVDGNFETIAMRRDGTAVELLQADSPAQAAANHAAVLSSYLPVHLRSFSHDLADCLSLARAEFGGTEDGGTSNFDSPVVRFSGAYLGDVAAAASLAGESAFRWQKRRSNPLYHSFVFSGPTGQGNRRTRIAERTAELLRARGYDTAVYYRVD